LHAGWNTVSLDLWSNNLLDDQAAATGCTHNWRDSPVRTQFRLDPDEIPPTSPYFHLSSVMLTAMDTASRGANFPIIYQLGSGGSTATFYYSSNHSMTGRQLARGSGQLVAAPMLAHRLYFPLIANPPAFQPPPGTQAFQWNLSGVGPGTYYISADVSDGVKTTTWVSDTPVVVN
jgi:hypothetical protein